MTGGSRFTIAGVSGDDLRSLRQWLADDGELPGPFELRHAAPRPGQMGSLTDALVVAAGSGGAITALAGVLVSWLRHRTSDLTITVTRPDGSTVEINASRIRGLDGSAVGEQITRLAEQLDPGTRPAANAQPADVEGEPRG